MSSNRLSALVAGFTLLSFLLLGVLVRTYPIDCAAYIERSNGSNGTHYVYAQPVETYGFPFPIATSVSVDDCKSYSATDNTMEYGAFKFSALNMVFDIAIWAAASLVLIMVFRRLQNVAVLRRFTGRAVRSRPAFKIKWPRTLLAIVGAGLIVTSVTSLIPTVQQCHPTDTLMPELRQDMHSTLDSEVKGRSVGYDAYRLEPVTRYGWPLSVTEPKSHHCKTDSLKRFLTAPLIRSGLSVESATAVVALTYNALTWTLAASIVYSIVSYHKQHKKQFKRKQT